MNMLTLFLSSCHLFVYRKFTILPIRIRRRYDITVLDQPLMQPCVQDRVMTAYYPVVKRAYPVWPKFPFHAFSVDFQRLTAMIEAVIKTLIHQFSRSGRLIGEKRRYTSRRSM